jgi:hypothetical protein
MNYILEGEVNAISSAFLPMATCTVDGFTVNVCNGRGKTFVIPGNQCCQLLIKIFFNKFCS